MVCIKSVLFYCGRKTKNNLSDMKARSVHRVLLPSLANAPEGTARSVACQWHGGFTVNIIYIKIYKYFYLSFGESAHFGKISESENFYPYIFNQHPMATG